MNVGAVRSLNVPVRWSRPSPLSVPPQEEPAPDPGDAALKRAFVWGFSAAGLGVLGSVASTAAYALGGPAVGFPVAAGLSLAAGIGGAFYLGDKLRTSPPGNRYMGFLAGAGAMGLATFLGASAVGTGGLGALAAAQVSGGFGLLYGGYGSLILPPPETSR